MVDHQERRKPDPRGMRRQRHGRQFSGSPGPQGGDAGVKRFSSTLPALKVPYQTLSKLRHYVGLFVPYQDSGVTPYTAWDSEVAGSTGTIQRHREAGISRATGPGLEPPLTAC